MGFENVIREREREREKEIERPINRKEKQPH